MNKAELRYLKFFLINIDVKFLIFKFEKHKTLKYTHIFTKKAYNFDKAS